MTMVNPAYDVVGYRGRNDDGTETSATWIAAENTNFSQETDVTFRVRLEINETAGGAANNERFDLQYNLNGAGWNSVTTSSSVVRAVTGSVADGTATTNQLTSGTGTFTAGEVTADGLGTTPTMAGNDHTEHEYIIQIRGVDVANNDSIQLRAVESQGDTTTQTANPTITALLVTHATTTPAAIASTLALPAASAHGDKTVEPSIFTTTATLPSATAVELVTMTPSAVSAVVGFPAVTVFGGTDVPVLTSTMRMGAP